MQVEHYQDEHGRIPFDDWFETLDKRRQAAVERRLKMLEEYGHFGDCRSIKGGLYELRLLGPGLRIYFTRVERSVVLLLGGSGKNTQSRTIAFARKRLKDFIKRTT